MGDAHEHSVCSAFIWAHSAFNMAEGILGRDSNEVAFAQTPLTGDCVLLALQLIVRAG